MLDRLTLAAALTAAALTTSCDSGGLLVADYSFEPECHAGSAYEQKAECDDGDPGTADRCVLAGDTGAGLCAHVLVDCDALDPVGVSAARCGQRHPTPCAAWRCFGDDTCWQSEIGGGCPESHELKPLPATCDETSSLSAADVIAPPETYELKHSLVLRCQSFPQDVAVTAFDYVASARGFLCDRVPQQLAWLVAPSTDPIPSRVELSVVPVDPASLAWEDDLATVRVELPAPIHLTPAERVCWGSVMTEEGASVGCVEACKVPADGGWLTVASDVSAGSPRACPDDCAFSPLDEWPTASGPLLVGFGIEARVYGYEL